MEERPVEMKKGRRERMRNGATVTSSPHGMTSWSSSIKIWFFQAYNAFLKCHGVKQNAKICAIGEQNVINEVFILGGQRIVQKRKRRWRRGRRERIAKREQRER